MSSQGLPISSLLPPLIDGCRYPHELSNPITILEEKRHTVLMLLRAYYAAVCSSAATPSEASQTSAPTRSERSTGTSITDMTYTFSVSQEPMQQEGKKALSPVDRARKHLMRELQACPPYCRAQKVKCKLWHHALRELLHTPHEPNDEAIVEWAIRYDAEPRSQDNMGPFSPRVASLVVGGPPEPHEVVFERVNHVFDISPTIPVSYSSRIQETDASLLGHSENISPRPRRSLDITRMNTPLPSPYSIVRNHRMFSFGLRCHRSGTAEYLYVCEDPGCTEVLPLHTLHSHFELHHNRFEHLREPLRMVCPNCDQFYGQPSGQCVHCIGTTPIEKVYGECLPSRDTWNSFLQSRMVTAAFSGYGPLGIQYPQQSPNTGFTSFTNGGGSSTYDNFWAGSSTNHSHRRHSHSGTSAYCLKQKLRSYMEYLRLVGRLPRIVFCGRRYLATCLAAVALLLISANEMQLLNYISAISRIDVPVIGVVLASFAFGLHRFIVHAHRAAGPHGGGWFSRCAISMFNAACGQPSSTVTIYELGHSRS